MYADVRKPIAHPTVLSNQVTNYAGQTFEGGISGKPDGEAHGAYAFCALGCLAILDAPHRVFPRYGPLSSKPSCAIFLRKCDNGFLMIAKLLSPDT